MHKCTCPMWKLWPLLITHLFLPEEYHTTFTYQDNCKKFMLVNLVTQGKHRRSRQVDSVCIRWSRWTHKVFVAYQHPTCIFKIFFFFVWFLISHNLLSIIICLKFTVILTLIIIIIFFFIAISCIVHEMPQTWLLL